MRLPIYQPFHLRSYQCDVGTFSISRSASMASAIS
jgi:hypothetical protein